MHRLGQCCGGLLMDVAAGVCCGLTVVPCSSFAACMGPCRRAPHTVDRNDGIGAQRLHCAAEYDGRLLCLDMLAYG